MIDKSPALNGIFVLEADNICIKQVLQEVKGLLNFNTHLIELVDNPSVFKKIALAFAIFLWYDNVKDWHAQFTWQVDAYDCCICFSPDGVKEIFRLYEKYGNYARREGRAASTETRDTTDDWQITNIQHIL